MGLAGIPLVFSVFTLGIRCRGTVTLRPRPSLYVGRFMLFYELHSSFFHLQNVLIQICSVRMYCVELYYRFCDVVSISTAKWTPYRSALLLWDSGILILTLFTSDKGGGKCVCSRLSVCLSVCLLARLLKNAWMDLDEILRVDKFRDMDELINFWPRSGSQSGLRNRIYTGFLRR